MGSWAPLQTVASGRAGLGLSLKPAMPIVGTQFGSFVYTSVSRAGARDVGSCPPGMPGLMC